MKRIIEFFKIIFLIEDHKHAFDYNNPEWELGIKSYPCKHDGCNRITYINQNGTCAFDDEDGRKDI